MLISSSPAIAVACQASIVLSNIAQAAVIPSKWASIKYSTVVGFFVQDLQETDDSSLITYVVACTKYGEVEPTDKLSNGRFRATLVSWIIFK
ncbi:hypothetical protein BGX38DRAFT_200649 [Terfezia claveryi]|nr:hypothetical protein BGX38DRAFT_200649 [Terfezia claveryi]